MPKKAKELTALAVQRMVKPGLHAVGGVAGLYLQVLPSGARSWMLRCMIAGKRRDMGLGGYPDVPLALAREKAREARESIARGVDPIAERQAAKSAILAARGAQISFAECARAFIEAKSPEWRNAKHALQWSSTLEKYAFPVCGGMRVRDVELPHVIKILEPIWTAKAETASRLRGRIEAVLDWAAVRKYREGENPARWRGHLDKLLPAPNKIVRTKHHRALPIDDMPAFVAGLRHREGIAARALEFLILTAARSGEVRGATWDEFDLDNSLWTVPSCRMKAGKEHRVPLTAGALAILRDAPRIEGSPYVFPAPRGGQLSDMSLTAVMRRMHADAVPHGFRSTFRDWASERTGYPREVAEMALAHAIGDRVEAAYRRGDLYAKHTRLMGDWARFCETQPATGGVIALRRNSRG